MEQHRDRIVDDWSGWVAGRTGSTGPLGREGVERQIAMLVDTLVEMAGPLRRDAVELWLCVSEFYGRTAAERGLAAGEVVEEMQHLRELLIRHLSEVIAAMPARYSMALTLRLNRLLDKGIAHAVVGYTDALVETLFNQRGVPVSADGAYGRAAWERIEQFESELKRIREEGKEFTR